MNDGYESVLASIASSSPTPGGGAVAALSISHGIALARMVSELTIGKEKWIDGHKDAEHFLVESETWIKDALEMAQEDCDAFDSVMSAYRLPKDSESQIAARKTAIRSANLSAAASPLRIAQFGHQVLILLPSLATNCNANAITDIGSASHMLSSGVQCAALNVEINLSSIGDLAADYQSQIQNILDEVQRLHTQIGQIVNDRM